MSTQESRITLHTTVHIEGIDNESLSKDVLSKSDCRISDDPLQSHYEDTELPDTENTKDLILKIDSQIYDIDFNLERDKVWSHIIEPQQSTIPHDHEGDDGLSFVYYVTYPKQSGNIVFDFYMANKRMFQTIEPKVGMLIIFPTWIPHYTTRNISDEKRISISGNYFPQ